MQIVSLSQWVNRREMEKKRVKGEALFVIYSITSDYEPRSILAYLRPTLKLVVYTRVMRDTL